MAFVAQLGDRLGTSGDSFPSLVGPCAVDRPDRRVLRPLPSLPAAGTWTRSLVVIRAVGTAVVVSGVVQVMALLLEGSEMSGVLVRAAGVAASDHRRLLGHPRLAALQRLTFNRG